MKNSYNCQYFFSFFVYIVYFYKTFSFSICVYQKIFVSLHAKLD